MKKYIVIFNYIQIALLSICFLFFSFKNEIFHKIDELKSVKEQPSILADKGCETLEDTEALKNYFGSKKVTYTIKDFNSNDKIVQIEGGNHFEIKDLEAVLKNLQCLELNSISFDNDSAKMVFYAKK